MINRGIIRNKVVQLTYAYYLNGNNNIESAEKELFFSLSKAYDLYNYLLALIPAITQEARKHYEVAEAKAIREGGDKPSQRFILNRLALQLEENVMLTDFITHQTNIWKEEADFIYKLFLQIQDISIYKEYLTSDDDNYDADREVWRKIYRTLIQDNEKLDHILEERSLYWNDDKSVVDTFVIKTIKKFDQKMGANQPLLEEYSSDDDRDFARRLYRATIINGTEYQRYMSEMSQNWNFNRLAYMDIVIMQIAIAELLTFPNIPISVTINEYVEIAKHYSTPRSGSYINGMLDNIARKLTDTGKILKPYK